ncbi:MAG: hypothetical protein QM736_11615 [Vicinamibacterales bacterium]
MLTRTVDVVAGFDVSRRAAGSEYRRLVTSNRDAIEQTTRLNQSSVSAGFRFSPMDGDATSADTRSSRGAMRHSSVQG